MRKIFLTLLLSLVVSQTAFSLTAYLGINKEGVAAVTSSVPDIFVGRQVDTFAVIQIKPEPVTLYGKYAQLVIEKKVTYDPDVARAVLKLSYRNADISSIDLTQFLGN